MTTPSWNLTIAYQGLDDPKITQDIQLIEQCITVLKQHSDQRDSVSVVQNAIQTSEAAGKLLATINTFATCHASVDATNAQAKSLTGKMAKLSSDLSLLLVHGAGLNLCLVRIVKPQTCEDLAAADLSPELFVVKWL